jgi:hypothetical protein
MEMCLVAQKVDLLGKSMAGLKEWLTVVNLVLCLVDKLAISMVGLMGKKRVSISVAWMVPFLGGMLVVQLVHLLVETLVESLVQ